MTASNERVHTAHRAREPVELSNVPSTPAPILPARTAVTAALLSSTIEFYAFFIYANAAALILSRHFFPQSSPWAQQLGAWASFAVAFLARPIGGILLGHLGDKRGAHRGLSAALLLMGVSTTGIGFVPGFQAIGWGAPILLCLLRCGQGLSLGGEWGGAVLLATDGAPATRKAMYGSLVQLGAPFGLCLADGAFLACETLLPSGAFADWGWRLPFLAAAPLIPLAIWARKLVTPALPCSAVRDPRPVRHVVAAHAPAILAGTLAATLGFLLFYLASTFAAGYAFRQLGHSLSSIMANQIFAALAMAVGILIGGQASLRFGRSAMMALTALIGICMGLLPPMLGVQHAQALPVMQCTAMLVVGVGYGPLGSWLPELFPRAVRYSGVSLAFNAAGVLGGATTPFAADLLLRAGGWPLLSNYVAGVATLTLLAVLAGRELRRRRGAAD